MAKRKRLEPARLTAEDLSRAAPAPAPPRRAPIADMAGDAAERAAFDEVAGALGAARAEGRLIQAVPLDEVDAGYLVRDRLVADPEDMDSLIESLRARGQQTAIEVADLGAGRSAGRYGLISGWRRLQALRRLREAGQGGETVLAIARPPQEAPAAYLAMVEENEIRAGLSYWERARIVVRAVERGVFPEDGAALRALFAAASRPRRSKIGSFVRLVRALEEAGQGEAPLAYPAALGERQGLALAKRIDADPGFPARLAALLRAEGPDSPSAEAAAISRALASAAQGGDKEPSAGTEPAPLRIERGRDGSLVLRGPALSDPAFRARLIAWLEEEGAA